MRKQLRPFYSREELQNLYAKRYDHTKWEDHIERIAYTSRVLDEFAAETDSQTVADLSCGDNAILKGSLHQWDVQYIGDISTTGPIEESVLRINPVDMFLMSETIEHIQDPDALLVDVRKKSKHLLLTTPCGEEDDGNWEHYWGWDEEGIQEILQQAGWSGEVSLFTPKSIAYYTFQIWRCS